MKEGEITEENKINEDELMDALATFGLYIKAIDANRRSPSDIAMVNITCWTGPRAKSISPYAPVRIQKNGPATIVFWLDGTKTIVKRGADEPDSDYAAFTAALGIKLFGSNSALKKIVSKTETQKPKVKGGQKAEQAGQSEPQSAEQTEDAALIEKVAAKFGMTAEQALAELRHG